jgi:quercetin dioxygenase-like cupin family protein
VAPPSLKEITVIRSTVRGLGLAFIGAAAFGLPTPAFAGQCPADQVRANPLDGHPTAPSMVTDDVVGSIDLGTEINVAGRDLRLRRLVVQPGGIVPFHSHAGRPALIITVSGDVTEYRSTCAVPIDHPAGDVAREAEGISHYWVNNGNVPAVLLSADVKARD